MPNPIKTVSVIRKATKLPGGKKGRAIEDKVRKEFGMPKAVTAGKAKVIKRVEKLDTIAESRTGGNLGYVYKKGRMTEVFDNHPPIKVKPRNIGKLTKQMAPNKKQTEKIIRKVTPKKPGIPVKRRSK